MLEPHTILSDDEVELENDSEMENEPIQVQITSKKGKKTNQKPDQSSEFHFDFDDGEFASRMHESKRSTVSNDEMSDDADTSEEESYDEDKVKTMPRAEERAIRVKEKSKKDKSKQDIVEDTIDTVAAESAFFDSVLDSSQVSSSIEITMFTQLNLSRNLLRAIEASGYITPTPVQAKVIPLALAGRDVCASAVTGSGKTAAFVLPILERLLFRSRDLATIRVLIVTPTRELALQIHEVLQKLAQFTDVTSCLITGGKKDLKSQEAMLRQFPDIVICTPGRFIDHLRNSQGVSVSDVDVLVLDEVDRLLDLGFQEEVEELLKYCPNNRQTLLFSATMTPKVEDLARLSLKKPVRVKTEASATTLAPRLLQEFIKLKDPDHEREAIVAALVKRSFRQRTIVFFETKRDTHRFYILLKLLNVKVTELHGDMTQTHRYLALEDFKSKKVDVLVCTDVAARGLDIPGIQTVINAEMPRNASTYVHRVGRTARAGCGGRSVTLVSDDRRKIMKEVLKGEGTALSADGGQVLSRVIPADVIKQYKNQIYELEDEVISFMQREKVSRKLDAAEREAMKAENMLLHQDEISSRPARTWYQTETQKKVVETASKANAEQEILQAKVGKQEALRLAIEKDDYRIAEEDKKLAMKLHRMSRKKRRRLEALKESENDDENDEDDIDEDDPGYTRPKAKISVKAIADRSKNAKRMKSSHETEQGIGERAVKKARITTSTGQSIVKRQRFAMGGLDPDVLGWNKGNNETGRGGKKGKLKNRVEEFRGLDAKINLMKKKPKTSSNAFKTKKRYKRR